MGGPGSGQWWRWDTRTTVEECRFLDAGLMRQRGAIVPGGRAAGLWRWLRGDEELSSVCYESETRSISGWLRLTYTSRQPGREPRQMNYLVLLESVPSNLGRGRVWYFRCPADGCGRRVKRLYSVAAVYACRRCYGLVYASTRISHQIERLAHALAGEIPGAAPDDLRRVLRGVDRETRQTERVLARRRGRRTVGDGQTA